MNPLLELARRAAALLRSARGAFDLTSVLVGAAVVAILVGGTAVTTFGVIPWAQDNGARQNLSSVSMAQGVAKVRDGKFLDNAGLSGAEYLNPPSSLAVGADTSGSCWVGFSRSDAGKTFYSTSSMADPQPFSTGIDTGCVAKTQQRSLAVAVGTPMPIAKAAGWGAGNLGQLGRNSTTQSNVPVDVLSTGALAGKSVTAVSSDWDYSCAVADGEIFCWGVNSFGQLGNGTTSTSLVPVPVDMTGVLAGKTVTHISASRYRACAIADGLPYCWGSNNGGRLGTGDSIDSLVPVAVSVSGVLSGKRVTDIDAGDSGTCVIADDGSVYCWGSLSCCSASSSVPIAITSLLAGKTVTSISVGSGSTCVVADGAGFCWGDNMGSFGNGNGSGSQTPVAVDITGALAGKTLTAISTSGRQTCALADAAVYCWGYNYYGAVGDGTTTTAYRPVAVSGALAGKSVSKVTTGSSHTCAMANEDIFCWGSNGSGRLGTGNATDSYVPVASQKGILTGKTLLGVSAGYSTTAVFYE